MRGCLALALVVPMLECGISVVAAQPVASDNSHVGVAVAPTTLGLAIEAAVPVSERINVRAGTSFFGLSHDFNSDGLTLSAQLKLRSVSTYLDWFPFGGGFHVSPGAMLYNGTEVDAVATVPANNKFTLGNEDLISSPLNPVTGSATIAFPRVAPSVLVGWGNLVPRSNRRWAIPFELGVVYTRAPTAVLSLGGSACNPNGTNCRSIAADPGLQADIVSQQNKLNRDLSPLKVLPVLSLGFSYKF